MGYELDAGGQCRLTRYFAAIGEALKNKKRRESFAIYALGLFSNVERKSTEPIAAMATSDPAACDACHQRLLHFLGDSPWSDREVRRVAVNHALEAMQSQESLHAWVVDDTGFLKQGTHSVGVQRQYTGSAGKIANCQLGVSLSVTTRTTHLPIDFELYLPEDWATDPARREECKIPDDVVFRTKEQLALQMIVRAIKDGVPGTVLLSDSWYGRSHVFRDTVRGYGFDYALGVMPTQRVWRLNRAERRMGEVTTVRDLARALPAKAFRRVTWRDGTMPGDRGKLRSRFAFCRVKAAQDDGTEPAEREPLWLLVEWPYGESAPTKYSLTTLPRTMSKKQIVRIAKERWRTERVYEDLKGELGLDHFEGRSYPGWHHHVTIALCCYAFVLTERLRHFPPEARRRSPRRENMLAA